jgi:hypothetical protein
MKLFICLICSTFYFFSCKESGKNNTENKTHVSTVIQEDRYDIKCRLLGVDNLKKSMAKPQIRVWIELSLSDSGKVLILKQEDNDWIAQFHQYRFDINAKNGDFLISHQVAKSESSKNGSAFPVLIEKLGIYNLNDNDRIENMGLCNDGGGIVVEIVRDGKYVEFIYPCWASIEDRTQINIIKNVLRAAEKEYGFEIFPLDYIDKGSISGNRTYHISIF